MPAACWGTVSLERNHGSATSAPRISWAAMGTVNATARGGRARGRRGAGRGWGVIGLPTAAMDPPLFKMIFCSSWVFHMHSDL